MDDSTGLLLLVGIVVVVAFVPGLGGTGTATGQPMTLLQKWMNGPTGYQSSNVFSL